MNKFDLTKLVIFDDRGYEVPLQKVYNFSWKAVPKENYYEDKHTTIKIDEEISGGLISTPTEINFAYHSSDENYYHAEYAANPNYLEYEFVIVNSGRVTVANQDNIKLKEYVNSPEHNIFFNGSGNLDYEFNGELTDEQIEAKIKEARLRYVKEEFMKQLDHIQLMYNGTEVTSPLEIASSTLITKNIKKRTVKPVSIESAPLLNNIYDYDGMTESDFIYRSRNYFLPIYDNESEDINWDADKTKYDVEFDAAGNPLYWSPLSVLNQCIDLEFEEIPIYMSTEDKPDRYEYKLKSIKFKTYKGTLFDESKQENQHPDLHNEKTQYVKKSIYYFLRAHQLMEGKSTMYPLYGFTGSYIQETVAQGLVAANTFFVCKDGENDIERIEVDGYSLMASFNAESSECAFITNNRDNECIDWSFIKTFSLEPNKQQFKYINPVEITFGFISNDEGVYNNRMAFHLLDNNTGIYYFLGYLSIKSTSEGEDERYRTMFTNFGIPDPVTYSNLFKEINPLEEGKDWEVINRKSKELFLTYDQIFPYVGTYKALINAVKFLGYTDVIFKEWYKIYDDEKAKNYKVALQTFDSSTGEFIKNNIQEYTGEPIENVLKHKKLNQISMIYLLNQKSGDYDTQEVIEHGSQTKLSFDVPFATDSYEYINELVLAKLYALKDWLERYIIGVNAKIVDVTGEGIYFGRFKNSVWQFGYDLVDYNSETRLTPFFASSNGKSKQMIDSSAYLTASFQEFSSIKFKDYPQDKLRDFISTVWTTGIDGKTLQPTSSPEMIAGYTPTYKNIEPSIPVSNPLRAVFNTDEYDFTISTQTDSGALTEHSKGYLDIYKNDAKDISPILIRNNEITIFDNSSNEAVFDQDLLPDIEVEVANIRRPYGNWKSNIEWTVKRVINASTGETKIQLKNVGSANNAILNILSDKPILFKPKYVSVEKRDKSGNFEQMIENPVSNLKYTEKTKWNVPLFVMSDYKLADDLTNQYAIKNTHRSINFVDNDTFSIEYTSDSSHILDANHDESMFDFSGDWILEVIEGRFKFNSVDVIDSDLDDLIGNDIKVSTEVVFSEDSAQGRGTDYSDEQTPLDSYERIERRAEQDIYPIYTYRTKRTPFYEFHRDKTNIDSINELLSNIKNIKNNFVKTLPTDTLKCRLGLLLKLYKDTLIDYYYKDFEKEDYNYDASTPISRYEKELLEVYNLGAESQTDNLLEVVTDSGLERYVNNFVNSTHRHLYYVDIKLLKYLVLERMPNQATHIAKCMFYNKEEDIYKKFTHDFRTNGEYRVNEFQDIKVNHLGEYTIEAKAYDEHNNIYAATSGSTAKVYGKSPDIDLLVNLEKGRNDKDFYPHTFVSCEKLSDDENKSVLDNISDNPIFPKTYRIPYFYTGKDDKPAVVYDNISYAIDTPKKGDYLLLQNFTERCTGLVFIKSIMQELYAPLTKIDTTPAEVIDQPDFWEWCYKLCYVMTLPEDEALKYDTLDKILKVDASKSICSYSEFIDEVIANALLNSFKTSDILTIFLSLFESKKASYPYEIYKSRGILEEGEKIDAFESCFMKSFDDMQDAFIKFFYNIFSEFITYTKTSPNALSKEIDILKPLIEKNFYLEFCYLLLKQICELSSKYNISKKALLTYSSEEIGENEFRLMMLDENPGNNEVFNIGSHLRLYLYDNEKLGIVAKSDEFICNKSYKQQTATDTNYDDDSYIQSEILETKQTGNDVVSILTQEIDGKSVNDMLKSGKYSAFINCVNEHFVEYKDIENDYSSKTSIITIRTAGEYDYFRVGDVIKTTYQYNKDTTKDFQSNSYIGETSYRIIECLGNNTYKLNGLINTLLMSGEYFYNKLDAKQYDGYGREIIPQIFIKVTKANVDYVNFVCRVSSDSDERWQSSGYNNTQAFQVHVEYNPLDWFANSYIDNSYSGFKLDFDPKELQNDWISKDFYEKNESGDFTHKFMRFKAPITLNKGYRVVVTSNDTANTFLRYKSEWEWRARTMDYNVNTNRDEYNGTMQQTLRGERYYRCVNDYVSVHTRIPGNNDIILTTYDIFGNKLETCGEGRLCVTNDYKTK